jgi:Flp pilus assembly protein CpaB
MARNRSTLLIAIGAAVFVLGTGMAFLVVHKDNHTAKVNTTSASASSAAPAAVSPRPALAAATANAPAPVTIPDGMEAIAVQVPFVQGVAGYAHAGDTVNVFAIVKSGQPGTPLKAPMTRLILSNVKVISETGPAPGADAGNATYLLALTSSQAEQIVYFTAFESLYLDLTRKGAPPAVTAGRTPANAL